MNDSGFDIIGVGMAVCDVMMLADAFPEENTKTPGRASLLQGGGPASTAMVAASQLGARTAWCGVLGNDIYGRVILDELRRYGVHIDAVRVVPGAASALSMVLVNAQNGSRTCLWQEATVHATPADVPDALLQNARFLHLDCHEMEAALPTARRAKALGLQISLDAGSVYPGVEALLPLVDILITSEKFALQYTGSAHVENALQGLQKRYSPRLLAITQGERGALWWREGIPQRLPAWPVPQLADTNGAGDVFHGAVLAALAKDMAHAEALHFAGAAAAMKCGRLGARQGAPGWDDVLMYMLRHQPKEGTP